MSRKKYLYIAAAVVILLALIVAALIWWNFRAGRVGTPPPVTTSPAPTSPASTTPAATTPTSPTTTPPTENMEPTVTLATDLEIPWALDFLPDGSIIFTERPGRVRMIDPGNNPLTQPLLTINEVAASGEGGLLGIAVHPDFSVNQFVYVYYTHQRNGRLANTVVRFRLGGQRLSEKAVIIDDIPAASIHDGGRIKFGPDGLLYIATGDSAQPDLAQEITSLAGKILRLNDDGSIPDDNPFPGSPVYSYGHRNPQGLAWDDQGRLWETEHGSSARDELNLIEAGKNYGWPVVRGDDTAAGMVNPVLHSGSDTWAPSGLSYFDGSLYFAGLRGQTLYRAVLNGGRVELRRYLARDFGRLRDVVVGPDNFFYILTSNRDGRALPSSNDDLILRVDPDRLVP
jgi:glucose/arabinose dehydrogenase